MDNKQKKEPGFYALISACSGLVISLLADCFFACLVKSIYFLDMGSYAEQWYYHDIMPYLRRTAVVHFFLNLLLVASGILIMRFHKNGKGIKKRNVVLAILLILEILAVIIHDITYSFPIILWVAILVCIIAAVLVGFYIRTYKTGTYVICCVIAIILSVPCTLFTVREVYLGRSTLVEIMAATFVLQPFAVLLPIVSLIKGLTSASDAGDAISQNDTESQVRSMGNVQMRCPFCGKEQAAGGRFCCQCGRELSPEPSKESSGDRHCPYCGAKIEDGILFCKECGTKIP